MRSLFCMLASLFVAACSSLPPSSVSSSNLLDDAAFETYRIATDASAVFAVNPQMRTYLRETVAPRVHDLGAQKGLVDALYSTRYLKLAYDAEFTRTAAQAFEARTGNCLSLVIMTAAFAKELGLDVRFQELMLEDVWVRDGDLVQLVGHVNVSLGRGPGLLHWASSPVNWLTVDFVPVDDTQRQRARLLDERRIVAMYFNNRGAEALAAGKPGEAYWWSRAGVLQDPMYAASYITLGVAARRSQRPDLAERAYRRALELDSSNPQALYNLAELLTLQGREDEAKATARLLLRVRPDSYAASYQQGLSAFRSSDYARARDALTEALRFAPEDGEIHYLLGLSYLRLGSTTEAMDHLRHARDTMRNADRKHALDVKISVLDKTFGVGEPRTTRH